MKASWLVVKCPRCENTSEIKGHGVIPDIFFCPVCLEGEIDRRAKKLGIHRAATESRRLIVVV